MEENMRAPAIHTVISLIPAVLIGASLAVAIPASVRANVITDWDAKAIDAVAPLASAPSSPYTPYAAYRMMGIVHAAMFDAVNSVERRYRPYLVQLPADSAASKEAAAAAAAAAVLATIDAKTAAQMKGDLASYLASMPDGATSTVALTEEVANARIWSGFHYRFSTRVGTEMGRQIGEYVVRNVMPVVTSSR